MSITSETMKWRNESRSQDPLHRQIRIEWFEGSQASLFFLTKRSRNSAFSLTYYEPRALRASFSCDFFHEEMSFCVSWLSKSHEMVPTSMPFILWLSSLLPLHHHHFLSLNHTSLPLLLVVQKSLSCQRFILSFMSIRG
jgi:hypothetical protein